MSCRLHKQRISSWERICVVLDDELKNLARLTDDYLNESMTDSAED